MKPVNQKAWFLILPVILCVAFSAILPLMTVVNYSVQDIISPERRVFVGTEWFKSVMRDDDLQGALGRQIVFSLSVLLVEIPLGIALALSMPAKGWKSSAVLVVVAISLLIPWNVVGTIWQIYGRADIGLMGAAFAALGIDYSYTGNATHAWLTVLLMDVWHWTPLVALLCFAGLRAIPDAYYQAASIDGALHPAAEAARRADDRGAAAFHGQLHDLHRALRADRRRARQRDHLPEPVSDAKGGRPVRPGAGRGVLADLLPHHPAAVFHPLQLDAAGRHGRQQRGGWPWMTVA
jgi:ABC-type spermidine/putrescine transport system permease subunit II